jgi:hypothetical protein
MAHHHGSGGDNAHAENYSARAHPEYIVLDIGGHFGALIVHTDAEMHGTEVEISPAERDHSRTHKDVLERSINGRAAYTAVFDRLTQGQYTLWVDDVARAREVTINGGEIAELDWTTAPRATRGLAASGGLPLS